MTFGDVDGSEMDGTHDLDDAAAEALLAGRGGDTDLELSDLLGEVRTTYRSEAPVMGESLASFIAATPSPFPADRRTSRMRSLLTAKLAAVVASLLAGTGGLAVAGALPRPLQSAVSHAASHVGLNLPEHASPRAVEVTSDNPRSGAFRLRSSDVTEPTDPPETVSPEPTDPPETVSPEPTDPPESCSHDSHDTPTTVASTDPCPPTTSPGNGNDGPGDEHHSGDSGGSQSGDEHHSGDSGGHQSGDEHHSGDSGGSQSGDEHHSGDSGGSQSGDEHHSGDENHTTTTTQPSGDHSGDGGDQHGGASSGGDQHSGGDSSSGSGS